MFVSNIQLSLVVLGLAALTAVMAQIPAPKWTEFKTQYGKTFADSAEEARRKAIYESNLKMVQEWNANPSNTFKLGMNELSDQTIDEIVAKRTGLKVDDMQSARVLTNSPNLNANLPIDSYPKTKTYVGTNMVSSVKDQGNCGSCWAFSVGQAVEGQVAKAQGRKVLPSEQQMVDCDYSNSGCNGGWFTRAYYYMANGIQNSSTYPYNSGSTGYENTCTSKSSLFEVYTKAQASQKDTKYGYEYGSFGWVYDEGYGDYYTTVYNKTIAALNEIGPLSIGVCAGSLFSSYLSGIYTNGGTRCTNSYYNHAVLLVGYDRSSSNSNEHYWIIKNSWGDTWWGEKGYIRMRMGLGLIRDPMYPILKASSATTTKSTAKPTSKPTTKSTAKPTSKPTTKSTAKPTSKPTTTKSTVKATVSTKTTPRTTAKTTKRTSTRSTQKAG